MRFLSLHLVEHVRELTLTDDPWMSALDCCRGISALISAQRMQFDQLRRREFVTLVE
jgi:hypothetical protein